MPKKYCPKCKKRRSKVLMVTEMIARWSESEEFYLPDDSKTDEMRTYEKCLTCGAMLVESTKKGLLRLR